MTLFAHFDGKVLVLDSPVKLPVNQPLKISVSTFEASSEESDVMDEEWLRSASKNSAFDFLKDEPNLYQVTDGKPFNDTQ